jgi:hypothetical protein
MKSSLGTSAKKKEEEKKKKSCKNRYLKYFTEI